MDKKGEIGNPRSAIRNPKSEIRLVEHRSPEYWQSVALHRRILRLPLGLDFTEQELAAENVETHFVAIAGDRVIGCLVMVPKGESVKMRQVAVEPECQGQGIGASMVVASEDWARQQNYSRIELAARDTAVDFYLGLGYQIEGEPFEEVTIPHRSMVKELAAADRT